MPEHLGICLNLRKLAPSQYANYNFNSFCELGGQILGAGDDGIFILDSADDDDGTPITAYFEPAMTDMGISNPKRMRALYMGYEANGTMKVTAQVDELHERAEYVFPAGKDRLQGGGRASGRRDQAGRYWKHKIENVDGCDFSVDTLEVIPIILPPKRR